VRWPVATTAGFDSVGGVELGLYSIFPVRADDLMIKPESGDSKAYSATVTYTLRTN
jgi:hypothetical protein